MASTPRLRGADIRAYVKAESTYGTAPSGDWAQIPLYTMSAGATSSLQDDPVLSATGEVTRDSTGAYLGRPETGNDIVVPVDLESIGFWLKMLLGAPSTTGSSDYVHTFVSGYQSGLPSFSLEKHLARISKYALITGAKANTLSITATTDQRPRATIGIIGQDEAISGSSAAGTPTFAGMTPFVQRQATLTLDGSAFGNCSSLEFMYSNGMEAYYDLNSGDTLAGIDEGIATFTGSATVRVSEDAATLITNAQTETTHALVLKWQISSTKLLQITAHDILLSRPTIGINGPGGTDVTFNFTAKYNSSGGEMVEFILKNQTASY